MLSNSLANDSIRAVHSVSDLCSKTRGLLEEKFAHLWVAGEIASISTPVSGHWYLSLKDDKAQIRCVMFKSANIRCQKPKVGDEVLVSGRFSLYEARGDLQLTLNHLEPRGAGALHKKFEALKIKLKAEGLFEAEHKRDLPSYPEHIALITSATGAALEDVLTVFRRHNYGGRVSIFASQVQGDDAPAQLIEALQAADNTQGVDLILLSRGGGSYEDLFCFNDEALARAVFATKKPVVSAVGHETDTTISDFVADMRSATPTAAAEQILKAYNNLTSDIDRLQTRLNQSLKNHLTKRETQVAQLRSLLQSPVHQLQNYQQKLDQIQQKKLALLNRYFDKQHYQRQILSQRLQARSTRNLVREAQKRLTDSQSRLHRLAAQIVEKPGRNLGQTCRHLESVSPMATLSRGYSVLLSTQGQVVKSVEQVRPDDQLQALVNDGSIELKVLRPRAKDIKGKR